MTLFKTAVEDGQIRCCACAVEGGEKSLPRARFVFGSDYEIVFPLTLLRQTAANSNVAAYTGYKK
jgi:hypothetical protein